MADTKANTPTNPAPTPPPPATDAGDAAKVDVPAQKDAEATAVTEETKVPEIPPKKEESKKPEVVPEVEVGPREVMCVNKSGQTYRLNYNKEIFTGKGKAKKMTYEHDLTSINLPPFSKTVIPTVLLRDQYFQDLKRQGLIALIVTP